MVWNYRRDGLNVYLKDLQLDSSGNPVILYLTSKGYESGPRNNPRTWMTARWNGMEWDIQSAMTSDNNYDTGSIYIENEGQWRIVAPTEVGPQPYNPGGEVVSWYTENHGKKWHMVRKLTTESPRNHTYVRRPVDAEHAFYSLWADGHARQPSTSELHFADSSGNVFDLPVKMTDNYFQCVDKPGPL